MIGSKIDFCEHDTESGNKGIRLFPTVFPFQGLWEGTLQLETEAGTGSTQDTGVWLSAAIVISVLPEDWIRILTLPWQQAALSHIALVILFVVHLFVCLSVGLFFFPLICQRKLLFGFFSHLNPWLFLGSRCKPLIPLSLDVSSQWDRMKGRIWNKILFECQPGVEEAGILPRENISWSFVRVWGLIQSFDVSLCLEFMDA